MKYAVSSAGSVAVAMMSRSRNVSLRRRTEPASDTATAAGCSRSAATTACTAGRPSPSSLRPSSGFSAWNASAFRIFSSLFAPRPGSAAQLLGLGRRLQPVERRDPELLPDPCRGLRPEAGQPHEQDDVGGDEPFRFVERLDLALLDDLDDLLLDRLADPLQLLRAPVERELRDRARRVAHPRRRAAVGDDPERLGALELQQVGEQVELVRDLRVLGQRRHDADHMRAPRYAQPCRARPSASPRTTSGRTSSRCCTRSLRSA